MGNQAVRQITPYLLVFPALLILSVFDLFPLLATFFVSLTDWNLISKDFNWIGLNNYLRMFTEPLFLKVVGNTLLFGLFSVGVTTLLAVLLAVLLDEKIKGISFFRGFIFLPYVTPMVAVGIVWAWIYSQQFGLLNWFLNEIGLSSIPWLTKPGWALVSLIITKVWKSVGYYTVILIAGKQNIPDHLYEAAKMDGAGRRRQLLSITLPLLSPYILFVLIVAMLATFQDFDLVFTMTRGGPVDSTNMLIYYIYQLGFELFDAGYSSAVAIFLFVLMLILTFFHMQVSKKWVHYE